MAHSSVSDLRIVLLGKNTSENNRVGNFILNKNVFGRKTSQPDVETFSERVEGRNITVINNTHLLKSQNPLQNITHKTSEFSPPEADVIILVLQHNDFSKNKISRLHSVLNCFGEDVMKRTMILTADDDTCDKELKTIKEQLIQQVSTECGGGRFQLQNTHRSQILQKVDEIITGSGFRSSSVDQEHRRSERSVQPEERAADSDDKEFKAPNSFSMSEKQKLMLVLCGWDTTLKTSMSKTLGKNTPTSTPESRSVCVRKDVEFHGHLISLVELPALSRLSEEEVMRQTLRCVSLCHPGVHAFIIVIPVGPLTDGHKTEMEKIQKIFDCREHFILLFTTELSVEGFDSDSVKSSPDCQRLTSLCGGQYRLMGLKEPDNSRQIPDLLDYIEKMTMKTEPYSLQMFVKAQENRGRRETEEKYEEQLSEMKKKIKELQENSQSAGVVTHNDDVRIVLLGKTGVGKSASGNTILGREAFKSKLTSKSVTRESQKETTEFSRRQITVIDTPGLFDTGVDNVDTRKEIVKCVSMAAPGPHVFLLVIPLGRFTKEEKDTVKMIQEMFGDGASKYTMVLFTKGDDLRGTTIEEFIEDDASLHNLIHQFGKRYHVFNNNESKDHTQVSELLDKIDCMVTVNGGSFYTNEMFKLVEKNIKEEQERILKEKEEEIKRKEEELRDKYEGEREQMKKENETKTQEMQNELRKKEEEFKRREGEIKKETDENVRKEMQRKLEEQQKLFEEENERKEKALKDQQQNFIRYLEEKHEKEKLKLQEKILNDTREQAEREYLVILEREVAKALEEAEEKHKREKDQALKAAEAKVPYRSKRARDWSRYVPVLGGTVGGAVGGIEDIYHWIAH